MRGNEGANVERRPFPRSAAPLPLASRARYLPDMSTTRAVLLFSPLGLAALAGTGVLWVKYGGAVYADALVAAIAGCF